MGLVLPCRLLPVFRSSSLTSYVELSKRYKLGKLQTNCGRLSHSVPGCSGAVQKSQDLQRKISRGSIARCAHLPTFIAGYEESSMLRLRLRPFKEAVSADQAAGDLSDTGQLHRAYSPYNATPYCGLRCIHLCSLQQGEAMQRSALCWAICALAMVGAAQCYSPASCNVTQCMTVQNNGT